MLLAGVVYLAWPSAQPAPSAAPLRAAPETTTAVVAAPPTHAPEPTVARVAQPVPAAPAPTGAPSPAHVQDARIAKLASPDSFEIVEAVDGLVQDKVTGAIPSLVAIDIRKDPRGALSVIHGLGALAADADASGKKLATTRLVELLAEEKKRNERESTANLLSIYEALGATGETEAATALEGELRDPSVSLSARNVVVESLIKLGRPSSRPALAEARKVAVGAAGADTLEEEIRVELVARIDRALSSLPN